MNAYVIPSTCGDLPNVKEADSLSISMAHNIKLIVVGNTLVQTFAEDWKVAKRENWTLVFCADLCTACRPNGPDTYLTTGTVWSTLSVRQNAFEYIFVKKLNGIVGSSLTMTLSPSTKPEEEKKTAIPDTFVK